MDLNISVADLAQIATTIGVIVTIWRHSKKTTGIPPQIMELFQKHNDINNNISLQLQSINNDTGKIHKFNNDHKIRLDDIASGDVPRSFQMEAIKNKVNFNGTDIKENAEKLHSHISKSKDDVLAKIEKLGGLFA